MTDETPMYTTNAEDQAEAAKLKARLENNKAISSSRKFENVVSSVSIDEGAHKYVLISAKEPGSNELCWFVISRRGSAYHRNAAEPMVQVLGVSGYQDITITGGGRIHLDEDNKQISVFGFSYGFGLADHELTRKVILKDERYREFDVTWSNDGY
jgi:phosphohistidine phosphatase